MNPYGIGFGRIPTSFINRDIITDEIIATFTSEYTESQCFKITGIRGSGKTVTMSVIEQALKQDDKWILIDISSESQMMKNFIRLLYDENAFIKDYVKTSLNLSLFGISASFEKEEPIMSEELAADKILEYVKKKGKRVLVTIDELRKTDESVNFIKYFQSAVRHELPIYLLATGLLNDIEKLENTDGLTFFYRAPKVNADPLDLTLIQFDYEEKLGVSKEMAGQLALATGGYAFAYQVIGKYVYESKDKVLSDEVLTKVDAALASGAYQKIWMELSPKEREYVSWLSKHELKYVDVSVLLDELNLKKNVWSVVRKKLIDKQLIDAGMIGKVRFMLPRFQNFIEKMVLLDM